MVHEYKEHLPMLTRLMIAASALVLAAACSNETPAPAMGADTASTTPAVSAAASQAADASTVTASAATDAPASTTAAALPAGADHGASAHTAAMPAPPAPAAVVSVAKGPATVPFKSNAAVTNYELPIAMIANFKLKDQTGKTHELYKITDAKVIVLTMHTKGCPIGQQLMPDFNQLHAKYEPLGVHFLMLNSNTYDTPAMIAEEATDFGVKIPILKDADQSVGEPLGVERSTETLIIEPGTWKILYQGPINDRVTYGRARAKADVHYASAVLDAMLAGQAVLPSYVAPEGCILTFDKRS
jgi:peroxiredoxin